MYKKISPRKIFYSKKMQDLCKNPYPNHPKGCPNYGKRKTCPPNAPLIDKILDFKKPVYIIYTNFQIGKFARKMKKKHPGWTERQIYNPLYWQGKARKEHREEVRRFLKKNPGIISIKCPEGYGVNVQLLMKNVGISLEWPPRKITRIISLAGYRKTL